MTFTELIEQCQKHKLSFSFEWDNGLYVPGEHTIDADGHLIPQDQIPQSDIRQGPSGFKVNIAGRYYYGPGGEIMYPNLAAAVEAGFELLETELERSA